MGGRPTETDQLTDKSRHNRPVPKARNPRVRPPPLHLRGRPPAHPVPRAPRPVRPLPGRERLGHLLLGHADAPFLSQHGQHHHRRRGQGGRRRREAGPCAARKGRVGADHRHLQAGLPARAGALEGQRDPGAAEEARQGQERGGRAGEQRPGEAGGGDGIHAAARGEEVGEEMMRSAGEKGCCRVIRVCEGLACACDM